jgi:polyisoprenoid-binding protein YceI
MVESHYVFDCTVGHFTVQVSASGLLASLGHNPTIFIREFDGAIDFDAESLQASVLELTVRAQSLEPGGNVPRKDRQEIERGMRNDVLDAARYPEIGFHSTAISASKIDKHACRLQISGNVSLRGITKNQSIEAMTRLRDDEIRLTGNFTLRQSDYNIKPVTALAGALKVKDELQLSFEIFGERES